MLTVGRLVTVTVLAISIVVVSPAHGASARPDKVDGLEAWWSADSAGGSLSNGANLISWEDRSGNEHHLTAASGLPPQYYDSQVNGKPAIYVNKGAMAVAEPFSLGEHTIFLVYRTEGAPKKAFFHGTTDRFGVMLRDKGHSLDSYQHGQATAGTSFAYNSPTPAAEEFRVSVLARGNGTLRAWLNEEDVSSNVEFSETIDVNTFFFLAETTYAKRFGNGLRIAEMAFYDRFLPDPERVSVTRYLSAKYAIGDAPASAPQEPAEEGGAEQPEGDEVVYVSLAQLSTSARVNLNDAGVAVPWDARDQLDRPFRHDAAKDNTKLFSMQDGIRVRLDVSLPLTSDVAGTGVRVLFRVNGAKVLRGATSGALTPVANGKFKGTLQAMAVTTLSRGDYVEVVTVREGAEGTVTVEPGAAVFIAEWK
jgi:hypothetical protein